jgi:adenosylhomocysteine nucleosidase
MADKPLGLVAAMPEESRPFLRRFDNVRQENIEGFSLYRFKVGAREVAHVVSGIGAERAAEATDALIRAAAPSCIINFGFAGAIQPGPSVGDIVVAERLLLFQEQHLTELQEALTGLSIDLVPHLERLSAAKGFSIWSSTFITAGKIVDKRTIAALLPTGTINPVLDMETAAVARVSAGRGIPLVAIRAVSDGSEEELGFTIDEFTDREMNISAWKVLKTLAGRPRIMPQLIRLARNSNLAGRNLAVAVNALLEKIQAL